MKRFADRRAAGRALADALAARRTEWHRPMVLALPRGGVPVAYEVARTLGSSLDVVVARKVGAPGQPEFGIGAIAEGGVVVADQETLRALRVDSHQFDVLVRREREELVRRVERYRGGRKLSSLDGRDVVLVDDGLATGVTAEAAIGAVRRLAPRRVVLAVPVSVPDAAVRLGTVADVVVVVLQSHDLRSVGQWYDDFAQTTDGEVVDLLARARELSTSPKPVHDG